MEVVVEVVAAPLCGPPQRPHGQRHFTTGSLPLLLLQLLSPMLVPPMLVPLMLLPPMLLPRRTSVLATPSWHVLRSSCLCWGPRS